MNEREWVLYFTHPAQPYIIIYIIEPKTQKVYHTLITLFSAIKNARLYLSRNMS